MLKFIGLKNIVIVYLLATLSIPAFAGRGGQGSGGGDAVICDRSLFESTNRVYLADTLSLMALGKIPPQVNAVEEIYLEQLLSILDSQDAEAGKKIRERLSSLQFEPTGDLPELDDDNINIDEIVALTGRRCYKKQLAIQDLETGEVLFNSSLLEEISVAERALFKIHEAYISLKKRPGHSDTTAIRKEVENIAANGTFADFLKNTILAKEFHVPTYSDPKMKSVLIRIKKSLSPSVFFNGNGRIFDWVADGRAEAFYPWYKATPLNSFVCQISASAGDRAPIQKNTIALMNIFPNSLEGWPVKNSAGETIKNGHLFFITCHKRIRFTPVKDDELHNQNDFVLVDIRSVDLEKATGGVVEVLRAP